jgi:hypothetical protein
VCVFTLISIGTFLAVRARSRGIRLYRGSTEELVESWPRSTQGIIRRHKPAKKSNGKINIWPGTHIQNLEYRKITIFNLLVINERIHQDPLLDYFPELRILAEKISIVVVGDDNAVRLVGQSEDVAIVVAGDSLATHQPRRCENQRAITLQVVENLLVGDGTLRTGRFFAPTRHENCDLRMAARLKPLDAQLNSPAAECLLVAVTAKKKSNIS